MKIRLDNIQLRDRTTFLGQEKIYRDRPNIADCYFMTEMPDFVVVAVNYEELNDTKVRHVMVPMGNIAGMIVCPDDVPKHQPLGIDPRYDTPRGTRKKRTTKTAKAAIAERIEAKTPDSRPSEG